jgi:3-hydroxyacyl-CoA dehydrogenase/3a,7a,12a-trihydroxy-5b-cholest-24-enoyl-CoA hydratase
VLPKELLDALLPEYVSPLVAYLCHESCEENGGLFEVGGGFVGKLRWERSAGASFKLGKPIAPEAIQKEWSKIAEFEKTTHPTDITQSMAPILENIQSKSKGGNDLIDLDAALGYEFPPETSSYDERDVALYALGVGAATNPTDAKDLPLVYELSGDGFRVLPTFGVVPPLNVYFKMAKEGKSAPGLNYGFDRVLHGEQYLEIKRPLPAHATLTHRAKVKDIFDKGKNALVITSTSTTDESGEELFYNETTTFVRGAGGWGGERGPSADVNVPPDRKPDAVIEEKTLENQALLYRLSGDWNPLHADPNFAANFGFKKPILHGLCTFGFAARHVIKAFLDGDPGRFKSIKVRFADTVFPGETIRTEMWKESDGKIVFRCKVVERDAVVISNAAIELYKEVPAAKRKPAAVQQAAPTAASPAAPAPAAAGGGATTDAIMFAIGHHLEAHPELVSQVANVFQWKLKGPDSDWVLDVKNGKGSCAKGTAEKPDVTLELSDADFVAMATGKADAQKLYFGGKLKIGGNVMASQKLEFLKKIDRDAAAKAYVAKQGEAPASAPPSPVTPAAPAATPTAAKASRIPALVSALKSKGGRDLAGTVQFEVKSPDARFFVDAKGAGEGAAKDAVTTIRIEESDLVALANGQADAHDLYMHGKLRVDGDARLARSLGFLHNIL